MSDELKPCPWCGETPVFEPREQQFHQRVYCLGKRCPVNPEGPLMESRKHAAIAWNTRAAKPAVKLPQWIPCAEQMPDAGADVLAVWPNGRQAVGNYDQNGSNYLRACGWFFALPCPAGVPIAWQPLPEGPS